MARRRRAIYVDELGHGGQPIPNACRIGNLIWSGGVNGIDPATGAVPEDIAAESAQMFANVRKVVEASGAGVADIIRFSVYARDRAAVGEGLNAAWVQMFPEADDRPARHLSVAEIHPALNVQCEFVAVTDD